MKLKSLLFTFFLAFAVSACSSLPSLPSMPWSSSTKADPTAEALYEEGLRAFNDKKYVRAIDSFSKLRSDHPFSPLITEVELKTAESYYFNQQYPEAINAYKEFQSLHPANENIPLVLLRLGQSHFNQFTSADRDQKSTAIAKGYFENLITNHAKSPLIAEAREKLAKCLEYLAEYEFNVAYFYFQQEKYPAARDRLEEIVRKYKDTPTAVKSLFYLGESYRQEKNTVRATLAFEALIQHYPQTKFAADAKLQLAQLEKEKHDPLALLLMRDRRPSGAAAAEVKEDPALAKLKDLNLVAKTDVVHEEPGAEKGFFRRVADKINPFSSSDSGKKEEPKPESAIELLAQRNQAQKKEESSGFFASLWPFGSKDTPASSVASSAKSSKVVNQIDASLKQKGIDSTNLSAAPKPPAADLPKTDEFTKTAAKTDTAGLLSSIDANLKKSGKSADTLPPVPEAAAAFRDGTAAQAAASAAPKAATPVQDVQSSGILSSIDQKLKAQGVDSANFQKPPSAAEIKAASAPKPQPKIVEIEPKLALEKGPLFLNPSEIQSPGAPAASAEVKTPESKSDGADSAKDLAGRVLVKGPVQPAPANAATKPAEVNKPAGKSEDEPKGVFEQMRQDLENVGKALNPFRW